jgi:hypothetical protein
MRDIYAHLLAPLVKEIKNAFVSNNKKRKILNQHLISNNTTMLIR